MKLHPLFFASFILCESLEAAQMSLNPVEFNFQPGEIEFLKSKVRGVVLNTFEDIISDPVFGAQLLQDPFYQTTQPLIKRDILSELPPLPYNCGFGIDFFFHQIAHTPYNGNKTNIGAYVDFNQYGVIEALSQFDFVNIDVPQVLALFDPITVQQRRIGGVLYYGFEYKDWFWFLELPVLYQEYNYYLTHDERIAIATSPVFQARLAAPELVDGPKQPPKGATVKQFIQQHLLSDKVGIGDTRVTLLKTLKHTQKYAFAAGVQLAVPTAFAFAKGIVGNHFDTAYPAPAFNLDTDLVALYGQGEYNQLKQNVIDFGVATLDRLSTIVLEQPLGNGHHLGIGPLLVFDYKPRSTLTIEARLVGQIFTPASEHRFFKQYIDQAGLDAAAASDPMNDDEALEQVNFLSAQLVQKMFPACYSTSVMPGFIVQLELMHTLQKGLWDAQIGVRGWCQSPEWILSISAPVNVKPLLDKGAATQAGAAQMDLWLMFSRTANDHSVSLAGSTSIVGWSVGRAFSVVFTIAWYF